MQKRESSEWWKWLAGALVVIALFYLAQGGPESAGKEPAPPPRPTPTPIPSYAYPCSYTPEGGVYCEYAALEATIAAMYAADRPVSDGQYHAEMEEAEREATIEALIEADLGRASPPADVSGPAQSKPPTSGQAATLVSVTDGDSIVVEMGGSNYRVRYIGMDTPEYGQYGFAQATDVNRQLLASGPLRLQKDVSETDQYGRLLRYVYAGDVFVNAELVRLGYAHVATYPPDVGHSEYFVQLQREAREAGRGLWSQ